jgi:two-component system, chemotaxis family, chemotaxis protein CheY
VANEKPTIMVVEDDAEIREGVCELLRADGYEVIAAEDGRAGLATLVERPDVRAIVLDLVMPVMNGATFRGQQLENPQIAAIPLILLTGRDDSATLAKALGVSACVQKPFTEQALLTAVRTAVTSYQPPP